MQVEHPFQIPAFIDNVQNDQAAVPALGSLHNLIRGLFVADHYRFYWVYVIAVVGLVALSTICGWCLLVACIVKKRTSLLTLHKIPKVNVRIGLPNTTCFTVFSASVSAAWYIIFAIHQFRLDQQLIPSELNASMFWMCVLCLPFWFTLYVQAIEFCDFPLLKSRSGSKGNKKVLEIILRLFAGFVAVIIPAFVIMASITTGYNNQQDYEQVVAGVMQFFADSDSSQEGFEVTGTSDGAISIFRMYEEDAIIQWKSLAGVYASAKPIMIIWASYFGFLLALYLGGAVKLYVAYRKTPKVTKTDTIILRKLEGDVESVIFDNSTADNEKQAKYPNCYFLQKYKHIFSVMLCIMFLVIYSFLAAQLTSLVEMVQITQFVGNYLGVLSSMMLCSSVYTIFHLSIMYANKGAATTKSKSTTEGDVEHESRSVDTDATLTS
ncbi:uncharacterized protein FA14DRAFT_154154 [Meira miltonrushii]|uniref:Uncharacterized protein n=1 Tax=Meira miltonrushii TaxID=1280837 RepID=A0A316VEI1_9BASI|nr:uncharacterized protein FA14DRAFT_154154 [Meira miltonrushii]PWN34703.1 hypothetical protein FA14DRAFT_154154 [Meira miltonrushii]